MKKMYVFLILFFFASSSYGDDNIYEGLSTFTRVLDLVERNYVDEIDSRELSLNAIEGMLNSLDPYSAYLTPDRFKNLEEGTSGEFGGVGMEITIKNGVLTVVSPLEDTPAYAAGIESGDQIVEINGKSSKKMIELEAVKLLRGPVGTEVTIKVKKKRDSSFEVIKLERSIIYIKSVKSELLDGKLGYVKLFQFQDKTSSELKDAIDKLQKENNGKLSGLILDLRNNPGGLLTQAVEVVDEFIDEGIIVSVKGRNRGQNLDYYATKNSETHEFPIVVLVNKGSASASEVVAEALQDYNRSTIIGTKTFGKGSVQTIIKLEDGSGLKITTAKFYAPSGRSINNVGVVPDVIVENKDSKSDLQLKRAKELIAAKNSAN
ncbi:MAG: S41 family peptidase [Deltaproteobacteria bacterium]|nr:MAG: S41 family peptidase [Deltaproteobacteria bacterium]TDJ05842.1 MAG: S41 family peptidase [Deltaproteobacteria bacterium]